MRLANPGVNREVINTLASLMLKGFKKPIVLTGSQLPLAMPRSDARQNLIDSITCATAACLLWTRPRR